ncbi:MAG: ABC transporter substrate-binding protein, partial [Clostridia bacterium]|nr:ABC transporter substrate-binding protein [Clostridia bacterium]
PAVEEIIKLDPDLVIIHPSTAKDGMAGQIRDGGVPAININFNDYDSMMKSYTILGEALGGVYQEKLQGWCDSVKAAQERNHSITDAIPEEERPVVYYISGQSESLVGTMAGNSIFQDWTEQAGGRYAAAVMNLTGNEVAAEEIFALDPDIIIVGGAYQHVLMKQLETEPGWKDLKAVKNGRVYNNPYACFNWERFGLESRLQLDYALYCIQPELAAQNGITRDALVQTVIDFYKTMNGTELTAEQAGFMLDGLQPDGTAEFPAA